MKHKIKNIQFSDRKFNFLIECNLQDQLINADLLIDNGDRFKINNPNQNSIEVFEIFVLYGNGNLINEFKDEIAYNIIYEINTKQYYLIISHLFDSEYILIKK